MFADVVEEEQVATEIEIEEPSKYKVIFLNDDYTPVEFVIRVLIDIFNKTTDVAVDITEVIHNRGSAVVGIYPYEIAEQKVVEATYAARGNKHPLQIKMVKA